MDNKLKQQLDREIKIINRTLASFGVNAGTKPGWTAIGGDQLILYTLRTGAGQAISDVERRLPELSEAISGVRRQQTLVRLLRYPLRLEVTHPYAKPLAWNDAALQGDSHALLLGRAYNGGARDLWLSFNNAPHILVAGTTGAGKSVELSNMLLGLTWNTSPADLRIALVDLKNTDLVPFRRLPHVDTLATDIQPAMDALRQAEQLRKSREGSNGILPRLLVVIDEYADISTDKNSMNYADSIARKGRSANVNLLVATQHPTGTTMGSTTIKSNFHNRIVGLVTDANAANNAAGRPGTHAELLPGKGAFLWINGPEITRFQSYLLTENIVESLITRIGRKWREAGSAAVLSATGAGGAGSAGATGAGGYGTGYVTGYEGGYERLYTSETRHGSITGYDNQSITFPIVEGRPLTADESKRVRQMAANGDFDTNGKFSMNRAVMAIYGSKNPDRVSWVRAAIDDNRDEGKIIKLRRTGTGGD